MIHLEQEHAVFFRMLSGFFGEERVIPSMSLLAACGGTLPCDIATVNPSIKEAQAESWARSQKCLFTVVDHDDQPKLVFDFFSGFDKPFEEKDVVGQRYLKPILMAAGVNYITISMEEFAEIIDPRSDIEFFHWLKEKLEIA